MYFLRYIISLVLAIPGILLLIANWKVFWDGCIKKRKSPSWIPFLPGLLICVAFLIIPNNSYCHLWWITFLLDWGSIPGITFSIFYHLFIKVKNK